MKALRRYLPELDLDKEIPREFLEKMRVYGDDFTTALKEVQPSAMREIFIEATNTRWSDVGGLDEARQEIIETIEWPLRNPKKFSDMGIKPPKGIVLYGPPGTGKTLLARAVAGESEANFVNIRGPELLSKWVGESEKAVRETFRKARQVSPSIIFFDELDALAPARGGGDDGSRVSERVVNQILTELDGLVELEGVVVIGASNRPDIIDPALMRPGRFDRLVYVGAPNREGRLNIFKIHSKKMPLGADVDLNQMAELTENYVGSDIEAVCREAAMLAMRENFDAKEVNSKHFHEAIKKVKPTMNDMVNNYYKAIRDHFKGGTPKDVQKAFLTPEYL
jgi:transitional endoplasmic reticulum ATPase